VYDETQRCRTHVNRLVQELVRAFVYAPRYVVQLGFGFGR
jgi:hypothetical protein